MAVFSGHFEEFVCAHFGHDYQLFTLIIDRNNLAGFEDWTPDIAAIHDLAREYADMLEIEFCMN